MTATSTVLTPPKVERSTCEPTEVPVLRSQSGTPIDSELIGHLRPTAIDTPLEEMRRRFREDGYVFVKGLLPRDDVLDMREQ
jgi:phytanoyl-CoA hydroxylase